MCHQEDVWCILERFGVRRKKVGKVKSDWEKCSYLRKKRKQKEKQKQESLCIVICGFALFDSTEKTSILPLKKDSPAAEKSRITAPVLAQERQESFAAFFPSQWIMSNLNSNIAMVFSIIKLSKLESQPAQTSGKKHKTSKVTFFYFRHCI